MFRFADVSPDELKSYADNLRALLTSNATRWGLVIERQVQFAFLPKISGTRAALEPSLWSLLVLLLEGHEAGVPALEDTLAQKALAAALLGQNLAGTPARFPKAAAAVARAMSELRELGVYPRPKLMAPSQSA